LSLFQDKEQETYSSKYISLVSKLEKKRGLLILDWDYTLFPTAYV
jgi:hypothetical protein